VSTLVPRPLIFLHVPKAAGSTLQEIIARQYAGGSSFVFTGDRERYQGFIDLPERERAAYDLLLGHVQFGIHDHLPDPATYITMLRDPIDRVVSHYHFILARPEHYLHESLKRKGYSLRDWLLEDHPLVLDNFQLRWLLPTPFAEVPPGGITRSMFDEARWNLENAFSVIGLVEYFADSLACFERAFGWSGLDAGIQRNITPGRPAVEDLDAQTLAAIRNVNMYDIELYECARTLFEDQCARLRIAVQPDRSREVIAAREAMAAMGDES
jgi:hypothetical protein